MQRDPSIYVDSRSYGITGPTRNVRFPRATPGGGGAMSKSEDGIRCAVTGKESLRIIYVSEGSRSYPGHKSSIGRGGYRIDASRNLWDGSGLKIDSASTDVAWGHGVFNNKILTSARNGELIMWDINKAGPSKYERRSKHHLRSINAMSVSHIVHHYCITGSADGDMRVWDLRDMAHSVVRVHHPTSVRSVAFSPSNWQPLHAIVGLDNGSIYRWDLKMGQRGLQDRLSVAHMASVTSLDWCNRNSQTSASPTVVSMSDSVGNGMGWLVSAGLDRCVKVWDLTASSVVHIPNKPTYTLHPSFPVRRVVWRPFHECELAVVSNAEFSSGSNHDLSQNSSTGAGGAGESEKRSVDNKPSVGGDAVEIWDVRRCYIPKWSVTGSAIEGGVTDLTFNTADAIWTQSSSGTFAQIDLRNCIKPLHAITTTTTTWESSGSLTFATGSEPEWQVPYDDIPPDRRVLAEKQNIKVKTLGDNCYVPVSQDIGTLSAEPSDNIEAFSRLARGYVFHGDDRPTLCAVNARVAFQASREELAQTWLLLGASLADLVPTLPAMFSPTKGSTAQPTLHAVASPAIPSSLSSYPTSTSTSSKLRKASPNHASIITSSRSASTSTSRKITPASSNASSPRQMPIGLPSTTSRRSSFFGCSRNVDSEFSRRPSVSMLRRPSISVSAPQSLSPADKANLRHVGEGALDDSDSSSDESDLHGQLSDEEARLPQLVSPGFLPVRNAPVPSPLSRIAGYHQWAENGAEGQVINENGDDSSSPSPGSTDTDSPESSIVCRRKISKSVSRPARRHSSLMHSRRRSSTVASLTAPATPSVSRTDSHSSIRTVLAIEAPVQEGEIGLRQEETIRDMRIVPQGRRGPGPVIDQSTAVNGLEDEINPNDLTERHVKIVSDDEKRLRKLAWTALRDALEDYADEGDVQMCAMLSIIAPRELGISESRASRFLESYIDLLTRRRLHACSAYLRKYCRLDDIRANTLMDTIIYTSCGRCKKAIMVPAGSSILGQLVKGGYSYCLSCQTSAITCAICRLPVRALLFQCSVCCHGGHQACYQDYLRKPMVDMPEPVMRVVTTRSESDRRGSPSGSTDDDIASTISTINSVIDSGETSPQQTTHPSKIAGHPCAAGCGHFCWVASVEP